jgi:signal transduction histidine kinase
MALKPVPVVPARDEPRRGPRPGPESEPGPALTDGWARLAAALWNPDSRAGWLLSVAGLVAMVWGALAGLPAGQAPQRRSAALVLITVASAAYVLRLTWGTRTPRATIVALVVQAVAGGLLGGFVPGGGLVFGYLAAYAAGRRLRPSVAAVIALCAFTPTAVIGWSAGRLALTDLLGVFLGFAALLLAGVNQASRRRLHEQAELIVAEGQVVLKERARSAALAERARIAREIHDVLAHSLSGLVVQL